jgi:hypothetical protein
MLRLRVVKVVQDEVELVNQGVAVSDPCYPLRFGHGSGFSLLLMSPETRLGGQMLYQLLEVLRLVRGREQDLSTSALVIILGRSLEKKPISFLSYLVQNPLCQVV